MGYLNNSGLNRFLNKLKATFALKSNVPEWASVRNITVDSVTYSTFWLIAPTASNQVYGLAFNPSNGQLCSIYNNMGTYTVLATTIEAMTATEIDAAIIAAGDTPDSSWIVIDSDAMSTADIDAAIAAAT